MKLTIFSLIMLGGVAFGASSPPYSLTVDFSARYSPAIEVYQANERVFNVRVVNAGNLSITNLSPVMWWAVSTNSSQIVTGAVTVINASNGTFQAVFSPSQLNTNGTFIYGVSVNGTGPTTARIGQFAIRRDPWATGAGSISYSTPVNWLLYQYLNTAANGPCRAGSGLTTSTNADGSVTFAVTGGGGGGVSYADATNIVNALAYPLASNPSNYCTLAAAAGLTNGLGGVSAGDVTNALNLAVSPSLTATVARAASALQGETDTLASVTARGSLMGTNYLTFFPIAEQVYLNTTGSYDDTNTDTNRITIMAHGGPYAGPDRGAKIVLRGNEYSASTGGDLDIVAGSPTDPRAGKLTLGTAGGYTILRQSGNWDFGGHSLSNGVYLGDGSALSGITAAQVGAVPTSGVTSIIYSNAALFELAGTAAGLTSGLPYGVSASTASNITRGVLGGETNGWTVSGHGGLWSKGDSVTNADLLTATGILPDGSLGTNSTRTVSNLTVKASATVGTLNGLTPSTILTNIPAVITPVTLSLDAGNTATVQNVFYNDLGILATNITVVIGNTMTNTAQARSFWLDWSNTTYSITFPVGSFSNVTANTATTNKAWSSYWHAGKGQTIFTGGWR